MASRGRASFVVVLATLLVATLAPVSDATAAPTKGEPRAAADEAPPGPPPGRASRSFEDLQGPAVGPLGDLDGPAPSVPRGAAPPAVPDGGPEDALPAEEVVDDEVVAEVIVRYVPGATGRERAAARTAGRTQVEDRDPLLPDLELLQVRTGTVEEAIERLERDPNVLYAEPNRPAELFTVPNDTYWGELWGLHNIGQRVLGQQAIADADIDAPEAWNTGTGSGSIVVGVVDTGVDVHHPDLADRMWSNPADPPDGIDNDGDGRVDDSAGWDFVGDQPYVQSNGDANLQDLDGHGTHVAGTIAAQGNNGAGITGVSWDARIMGLRVCGVHGPTCFDWAQARAYAYAGSRGAHVVNASLGGESYNQAVRDVIADYPDTLFVFAAGNENKNNDAVPSYPCGYDLAHIICVAATTQTDARAPFSNWGATQVDLGAPGTEILSTFPRLHPAFTDGFGGVFADNWVTGGTGATFQRACRELPATNARCWATDGAGPYGNNADAYMQTRNPISLAGSSSCRAGFSVGYDLEAGYDFFNVYGWNGTSWQALASFTGSSNWRWHEVDLAAFLGRTDFYLLFQLVSDGSVTGQGIQYLDDVAVRCELSRAYLANDYRYLQGTSMASPHVAGAAAVLFDLAPGATVQQVKAAILNGVDPVASMAGITVTGGRLNLANSVALLVGSGICPPDDAFEPNDTIATATPMESGQTRSAIACPGNDDYFSIAATAGQRLDALVEFSHADGDIDVRLYDAGGTQLATGLTTTDDETVSIDVPATGTYYLRVYGYDGAQNTYDVTMTVRSVPGAPSGVSAVAGNGTATVNWAAPGDGGSPITGYTVTASPGGATVNAGPGATSQTVTGLTNGTPYTFTVRATNAVGSGPPSAPSAVVTPVAPGDPSAACHRWAAPDGNDGAAGTEAQPVRTIRTLAVRLEEARDAGQPGQVGCLKGGGTIDARQDGFGGWGIIQRGGSPAQPVTIRSAPGERATMRGIVEVQAGATDVTLQGIDFVPWPGEQATLVRLLAHRTALRDSDVTNPRGICVQVGRGASTAGGQDLIAADDVVVDNNRVHRCGVDNGVVLNPGEYGTDPGNDPPMGGSGWHGLYIQEGSGMQITNNIVYDNSYRGLQLYPNPKNVLLANNVFDENASNLNFGHLEGSEYVAENVTVRDNIISNARLHPAAPKNPAQVYGNMPNSASTFGNVVRDNCMWFDVPSLQADESKHFSAGYAHLGRYGFVSSDNLFSNPAYADRAARDYRLPHASPCVGKGPASIQPDGTPPEDTAPPVWAAGAELTASGVTTDRAVLSWPAATDDRPGAVQYQLRRGGTPVTDWITELTAVASGLAPDTSYTFTVVARDVAGNVTPVALQRTVRTSAAPDTAPPVFGAGGLVASEISTTALTLTWPVATDPSAPVTYTVRRGGTVLAEGLSTTTYRVTGLSPDTEYGFSVTATDAVGNTSAALTRTARTLATADTSPPVFGAGGLTASEITTSALTLAWPAATDPSGPVTYTVRRGGAVLAQGVTARTLRVTGLSPDTEYGFSVTASDAVGNTSAALTRTARTLAVTTTEPTPPTCADARGGVRFRDVDPNSVHGTNIICSAGLDLVTGRPDGTYDPGGSLTRGQTATILLRALERSGIQLTAEQGFRDVPDGHPHGVAIRKLAAAGVLNGTSPTTFGPGGVVTRAQFAALLDRASTRFFVTYPEAANPFRDVAGSVHEPAIRRLAGAGVIRGTSATTFGPAADINRAQAASLFVRWLEDQAGRMN